MQADRFALPLRETLDMNGYFTAMTVPEQASCYADLAREHEQTCSLINRRIAFLASHAGRPFPNQENA